MLLETSESFHVSFVVFYLVENNREAGTSEFERHVEPKE